MSDQFSRTELLLGKAALEKLHSSKVAVFGIGGVGGYAVEALARSGVGSISLIDNDTVSISNINRQIIADHSTVGMFKTDAAEERILRIYPDCKVTKHRIFYTPETAETFDISEYDYVIDAIDTVSGKIELAVRASELGVPIISSMGAGNKLDPTALEVADIYETSVCPLARVMRYELRKRNIPKLKVVYSKEKPVRQDPDRCGDDGSRRKAVPASIAFVPSVAGLIIAGEVIKDLCGLN